MALFSRDPHEHWPKRHFSKNEVANSGFIMQELRRRHSTDEWEKKFDSLVETSTSRLRGTAAYKFNRADAYAEGEFA